MYNDLQSHGEEGIIFLTRWRGFDFFLSYNKKTGRVLFYTSISQVKHIIQNDEVIKAIVDTCLDLIGQAALAFSKTFDNINYMGNYKNKEYWALTNNIKDTNLSIPSFVSFDGKSFNIINCEEEKNKLLSYFNNYQWKSEEIIPTGKW